MLDMEPDKMLDALVADDDDDPAPVPNNGSCSVSAMHSRFLE